jgi:hypothetical protein
MNDFIYLCKTRFRRIRNPFKPRPVYCDDIIQEYVLWGLE